MNLLDSTPIDVQNTFSPQHPFAMINADTLEACRYLPQNLFSLIITSPPYNIGKQYEQQTSLARYLEAQQQIIEQLIPLLKPSGSLCWQVLDPFAGVGSTLIAAAKHGRRAVGIDRDADYCQIAKDRLLAFQAGNLKLRPLGKPVHKPSGREKVTQVPAQWSLIA